MAELACTCGSCFCKECNSRWVVEEQSRIEREREEERVETDKQLVLETAREIEKKRVPDGHACACGSAVASSNTASASYADATYRWFEWHCHCKRLACDKCKLKCSMCLTGLTTMCTMHEQDRELMCSK